MVVAAVVAFLLSRVYFYGFFIAGVSDVTVYFSYAVKGVDGGLLPYRDIRPSEYPPVAYWIMCLPRLLSSWRLPPVGASTEQYYDHLNHYDWGFRGEMLAFDVGSFALLGLILIRRRPELLAWGLWSYIGVTSFLVYLLHDRLDIGLTFAMLAWAYAFLRANEAGPRAWAWSALGYAVLGFGISYKLVPIVLAPFALLCDFFSLLRKPRDWRLLVGPAALVVAGAGPYVYYYARVGDDLFRLFEYHATRGIQIESSYATVLMLGVPREQLECYYDFGSWNLRGPWEPQLLRISNWLLPAALALLGLRSLAAPLFGRCYDRAAAVRMGAVVVAVATILAKVLSPQYLLWALPMLLVAAAETLSPRAFKHAAVWTVAAAALTCFLYPCHYVDTMIVPPYSKDSPPWWSLIHVTRELVGEVSADRLPPLALAARNTILLGLTVVVAVAAALPRGRTFATAEEIAAR